MVFLNVEWNLGCGGGDELCCFNLWGCIGWVCVLLSLVGVGEVCWWDGFCRILVFD